MSTGLQLKLARVASGVPQRALARQLGLSPQRVAAIEAAFRPSSAACARYLAALDALSDATATSARVPARARRTGARKAARPPEENA